MKKKPDSNRGDADPAEKNADFGLWASKESGSPEIGSAKQRRSKSTLFPEAGRFARAIHVSQLAEQNELEQSSVLDSLTGSKAVRPASLRQSPPEFSEYRPADTGVSLSQVARKPVPVEKEEKGLWQASSVAVIGLLSLVGLVSVLGWYLSQQPRPQVATTDSGQDSNSQAVNSESTGTKLEGQSQNVVSPVIKSVVDRPTESQKFEQGAVTATTAPEVAADFIEEKLEKAAISTLAWFDSAEQEYQEILVLDPQNAEALAGLAVLRERALHRMNQVINRSLLAGYSEENDAIGKSLGTAQGFLNTQIEDLREMCLAIDNQIVEVKQKQYPWWIALANRRLRDGVLTRPERGSALYAYRRAEAIDETAPEVASGLARLRQAIIQSSGQMLDAGDAENALAELEIAQGIRSEASIELLIKQIRLSNKKRKRTPETYVIEADALIADGRLLGDDGALAVLNRALVLDPASQIVNSKRRELAALLVQRAEDEAAREAVAASIANLKIALAVEPDNDNARTLLQTLTEQSVGAGDVKSDSSDTDTRISAEKSLSEENDPTDLKRLTCERDYECIGIAVDTDDRIMSKLASEFSAIVTGAAVGTVVKPTNGPVASTVNLLSKSNAGLSVLPSDMLRYTARADDPVLATASRHLRYVMSLGTQNIYLLADAKIEEPADLAGKHVVLGPKDDNLWVVANNLLHAYGVEPGFSYDYDSELAVSRLVAGDVDAVFLMSSEQAAFSPAIKLMLDDANQGEARFKLVGLPVPSKTLEYSSSEVSVIGLGEKVETVSVKPILVSYNFAQQGSDYFNRRCDEMAQVGSALISQINELKDVGHPLWSEVDWVSQCGDWRRDECFFRNLDSLVQAAR